MEIDDALKRISEIHNHLGKTEVYRGYRAIPVALGGGVALVAAWLQPLVVDGGRSFVVYWVAVAVISFLIAAVGILRNYFFEESQTTRRRTRAVLGQVLPAFLAGALVTFPIAALGDRGVACLPGLWALLFSLGIFASRHYLPRAHDWIALFYFLSGAMLLLMADGGASLSPWGMGLTFGAGEIASGLALFWNLERNENG